MKTKHKKIKFILFFGVFFFVSLIPHPPSLEAAGTEMMNSYGEKMEMDFKLYEPGSGDIVDYSKYGEFKGVGTDQYDYKITDRKGLATAVGEGIYPNNSVYKDPAYKMLVMKGRLSGGQWDYVNVEDQQLAFYKWATTQESAGVKLFYTAMALEKLGQTLQAIKAYYAVAVHFPRQVGWTVWHTPLYVGRVAIDRIQFLTRRHPELGIKLEGAKIRVENGYDFNINNDRAFVNPGRLVKVSPEALKPRRIDTAELGIEKTVGTGLVQLVRFQNGHWQMRVNGKPFMVKAVAYSPTPVGKTPDKDYSLDSWQTADLNNNGFIDGPYDSWVDADRDNQQGADEKAVGDFALMKRMGVNTIRFYHHPQNKELLRKLHRDYGIYVILGDLLGMYAVGSGAEWYEGTDYTNPAQKEKMKESVRKLVEEYKNEPYVLFWMLGNESNYGDTGSIAKDTVGFGSQARRQPEALYAFANEVAGMIKLIDPTRPVGFSNGDVITIDVLSKHQDNIDVFGTNAYRGASGFGRSLWEDAKDFTDKPVLITEYGCPGYFRGKDVAFAEAKQAEYHQGNWEDILYNSAGSGQGNAIGGVVFEFLDEWWKAGPPPQFNPSVQETVGQFAADFPDGWMHEEWLGVVGQGDGKHSPYLRQLKKTYEYYEKAWNG